MELLFHISLIVIVALAVRLLLQAVSRPQQLAEPTVMLVIVLPVALALWVAWIYTLMEMLVFVFSIFMIGVLLLGIWFYVLQPLGEAAETSKFHGLNVGDWSVRWDYFGLLLLAAPVFLLILTYNYFAGFFDFGIGRLLPLMVLGYVYFQAILRR
jgi:hypothetical protein